ncbi:MAG TPA: hypothetical protein VF701_03190 [Thermoanaerobaculia bacterium]
MSGWTLLGLLTIGIALYLLLSGFLKTWRTYRGVRVITCPENMQPAAVKVAAVDAAKWFAISGETSLHLRTCTRWPEMAGCDEACLKQVEASPHACSLQTIVSSWYEGKSCCFCQREIGPIVWHDRPPALRLPDGTTREWKDVSPDEIQSLFATSLPVCWACHTVEDFRHDHKDLVIERPRPAEEHHALGPTDSVY